MFYSIISFVIGLALVIANKNGMTPENLGGLPCLFGIAFLWASIMNTFFWKYGFKTDRK